MVGVAAVSAILFFVGTAAALILPLLTQNVLKRVGVRKPWEVSTEGKTKKK